MRVVERLPAEARDGFTGVEKAPTKAVVVLTATFKKKVDRDLNNDHMEQVLRDQAPSEEPDPEE